MAVVAVLCTQYGSVRRQSPGGRASRAESATERLRVGHGLPRLRSWSARQLVLLTLCTTCHFTFGVRPRTAGGSYQQARAQGPGRGGEAAFLQWGLVPLSGKPDHESEGLAAWTASESAAGPQWTCQ